MKTLKRIILLLVAVVILVLLPTCETKAAEKFQFGQWTKMETVYKIKLKKDTLVKIEIKKDNAYKRKYNGYEMLKIENKEHGVWMCKPENIRYAYLNKGECSIYSDSSSWFNPIKVKITKVSFKDDANYCVNKAKKIKNNSMIKVFQTRRILYKRWYKFKINKKSKLTIKRFDGGYSNVKIVDKDLDEIPYKYYEEQKYDENYKYETKVTLFPGTYYIYVDTYNYENYPITAFKVSWK